MLASARASVLRVRAIDRAWRLTRETVAICMRYRVTGLASEAGFFALLSLPPLILGLFGGVGYFGQRIGQNNVQALTDKVTDLASKVLTATTVRDTIVPTLNDVLQNGRADLISIGFLLSLWSGSRVLNVFIDTISIMYGQSGVRGIVRTRALSFSLYVASLLVGVVIFPLVILGPDLLRELMNGHLRLAALALLAGRDGPDHRQPHLALLDRHPSQVVLGPQHARSRPHPGHLGGRQRCPALGAR